MLFELTQAAYSIYAGIWTRNYLRDDGEKVTDSELEGDPADIQAFMPVHEEEPDIIDESLSVAEEIQYPDDRYEISIVYSDDDPHRNQYEALKNDYDMLETVEVPADVEPDEDEIWEEMIEDWADEEQGEFKRCKARDLEYARRKARKEEIEGEIVTVLDADTFVPEKSFKMATSGIYEQDYDIVQAKEIARNTEDGILPTWDSFGESFYQEKVYEEAFSRENALVPYLRGKCYFLEADTLAEIGGWNPDDVSEDLDLGVRGWKQEYDFAILEGDEPSDMYVREKCPSEIGNWMTQRRRWLGAPYDVLTDQDLSMKERAEYASYTISGQSLSITHTIGLPTVTYETMMNTGTEFDLVGVGGLSILNMAHWLFMSAEAHRTADRIQEFDSSWDRAKYHFKNNPVFQLGYGSLWSIPAVQGFKDWKDGVREFDVTPKEESSDSLLPSVFRSSEHVSGDPQKRRSELYNIESNLDEDPQTDMDLEVTIREKEEQEAMSKN